MKRTAREKLVSFVSILVSLGIVLCFGSILHAEDKPDLSNEVCLSCHSDPDLSKEENGKKISLFVDEQKFTKSVHGSNDCISCHEDIADVPHSENLQKVACANCHGDEGAIYEASTHGKAYAAKIPEAPTCATCHGHHDISRPSDPASRTHPLNQVEICTSCHLDPKIAGKYNLPTADKIEAYKTGIHGRALIRSGLMISATCVSCHTAHNVRPKTDPQSTIYWSKIPQLCGTCHLGILEQFVGSEHGALWKKKSPVGPGCVSCHGSHGILDPVTPEFQLQIPNLCGRCHKAQAPTYKDNFHGQITALGFVQSATCADCHTPHRNLRKENPKSTVNPANLKGTCAHCHGKVDDSYVTYDPHMNPKDPNQSKIIHLIWQFFMVMIYLTFGFFGVHYFLWFMRTTVGYLRGEFGSMNHLSGPYIRRFSGAQTGVHLFVALSFTVLAVTGFTIYFHDARWAQVTVQLLGGIGFMRYLHRLSALITFGYAFFHLGHLAYCYFVKKEKHLFHGPSTMVPNLKDITDFFRNIRWFLFLGPIPKFDRWTYWEKLEYLVEFWGIPVIGLSGLALWFPKFFTSFLPGWVLNAAQVVHTYEAFLAAGYVFLFHYFVAHMRPETFPIDMVMFTGRMPLERFKHERPLEYERLVANGELEKHLDGPPTSAEVRFARIFGFILVAAGLLLMIGILKSVFFGF